MRVSGDFVAFLSAIVDVDGDQGGWGYCRSAGGTGGSVYYAGELYLVWDWEMKRQIVCGCNQSHGRMMGGGSGTLVHLKMTILWQSQLAVSAIR